MHIFNSLFLDAKELPTWTRSLFAKGEVFGWEYRTLAVALPLATFKRQNQGHDSPCRAHV